MLVVYAFASYGSLFHEHETTGHIHEHGHEISLEDHILLSSACHNSIYHNTSVECGHNKHFSASDDSCFGCDFYISQNALIAEENSNSKATVLSTTKIGAYRFFYSKDFSHLKPNRGPPVFVI